MAHPREVANARTNRLEIIKAGLDRRDLFKMGLLTGAGYLVRKNGLSAWAFDNDNHCGPGACNPGCSPKITPFLDPLPIPPVLPERTLADPGLTPAPQEFPNNAINPLNQLPFEGRGQFNGALRPGTDSFQFFTQYPVQHYFAQRMRANSNFRITSDTNIPAQTIWGFNQGGADPSDIAISPGPTIVAHYQQPIVIRRFNELPPQNQNGGFGVPETSTHLHNFHAGTESDGGPCRYFFRGQYFDYYDTLQQAGFDSTNPPNGDINESMSTLWYHDHRVDHTAENVYKGLAGFHLFFNNLDTGDEGSGFHLPSFPQFDIPILLADKLIDPGTGLICFDTFENDGLVGDVQLANGKVQPFLEVSQRRYRFRILDGGPSRFYQLFLTNPNNLSQVIPFWVIANDGNLLPSPVQVTSFRLGVAERFDIIIDFKQIASQFGTSVVRLENRLQQNDGRAPTNNILPAGRGIYCMEFRIGAQMADGSVDPATAPHFYNLPSTSLTDATVKPRITRTFTFDQSDGGWVINDRFMSCNQIRFTVQRNSIERWILQNDGGEWQHPIHIHLEEFQILRRGSRISAAVEHSRKDVLTLNFDERAELFFRFRDFRGDYPMHCHNTIHEDHAMMLLFQVQDVGDNKTSP
jgi:FtsP/CotA-like multicopper oxidase with cupredoxin domain